MSTKAKATVTEETPTEETPTEETAEVLDKELERLVPEPGQPFALADGTEVIIRPLKLRELFALLKILTRGAAMAMGASSFRIFDGQDEFAETLIALLINAIPEAEDEVMEFLRVVVDPAPPKGGWKTTTAEEDANHHLNELLLINPEIDDMIDILTAVVYAESQDIERLGKKLRNAMTMFAKVTPKN